MKPDRLENEERGCSWERAQPCKGPEVRMRHQVQGQRGAASVAEGRSGLSAQGMCFMPAPPPRPPFPSLPSFFLFLWSCSDPIPGWGCLPSSGALLGPCIADITKPQVGKELETGG